ncbi:hypothetical protein [Neomicrococcus aestuarii]|uniref:hypothetical protein n=1 Tax=Neomicrococcus aestuarii TaxID=556325 RepID=UPI0012EE16A0|nr:hypothetical protein [Neomicrococcus aestuarii]
MDNETFLRFRNAVERKYFRTRSVAVYARRLGYSARTLSRAALVATWVFAKAFIDGHVMLEAKRLLAHGQDPVALRGPHRLRRRQQLRQILPAPRGLNPGSVPPKLSPR